MLPLAPVLAGETAIAVWGFIGLKFAGQKLYIHQENRNSLLGNNLKKKTKQV